jgi:RNA polymerase sigma-70 factor (ECF subfamily)
MEPTYTDAHIIDLYWRRDEQAIHATAGRYGLLCMQTALGILHNRADAEECVSDAYLKVWNAIPPARPRSLGAFIARITRNLALDRYRARMRSKRGGNVTLMLSELSDCIPAPEEEGSAEELLGHIKDFLRERDELDRRLFVGRYFHAYEVKDMAKSYGLTPNAASLRLRKTREGLRAYLNERGYSV